MRYSGIEKMHTQNLMETISYNLYRGPWIIMSNSVRATKNEGEQQEIGPFKPIGEQKIKKRDQKSHNSSLNRLSVAFCNGLVI